VRLDQVQAGRGYRVEVPRHLPPRRYPVERLGLDLWWHLSLLRGSYFELSVTNPQVAVGSQQWVEGWRLIKRGLVEVELTPRHVSDHEIPQVGRVQRHVIPHSRGHVIPQGDREWRGS